MEQTTKKRKIFAVGVCMALLVTTCGCIGEEEPSKNELPIADFTYNPSNPEPSTIIQFIDQSYDPDGSIDSRKWYFGDGDTSNEENPIHVYSNNGVYTVTLVITDDYGGKNTTSKEIEVIKNVFAVIRIDPTGARVNESIEFDGSNSYTIDDESIVSWEWSFGDGSIDYGEIVTHSYTKEGSYNISLTVTDSKGRTDTSKTSIIIAPPEEKFPPVAIITEPRLPPNIALKAPATVKCNASDSYDYDGEIIHYVWDYGNGEQGYGKVTKHTYYSEGSYTITLTVTDNDGLSGSTTVSIYVISIP